MSQLTVLSNSKWLTLYEDRPKQKTELNLLTRIDWQQGIKWMLNFGQLWVDLLLQLTIVKYFENLQLGHAKCHKFKKLNY